VALWASSAELIAQLVVVFSSLCHMCVVDYLVVSLHRVTVLAPHTVQEYMIVNILPPLQSLGRYLV